MTTKGRQVAKRVMPEVIQLDIPVDPGELQIIMEENFGDGTISPQFDRVKVPAGGGKLFEVPTAAGEEYTEILEGIVLYHHTARAYWASTEPGGNPPDCASVDGLVGQGDPGGSCARCPFNAWGSDLKGGRGKACKEMRRVYLLRGGETLPVLLTLPPTSIRPMLQYATSLTRTGTGIRGVLTSYHLEQMTNAQGQVYSVAMPQVGGALDEVSRSRLRALADALAPYIQRVAVTQEDYNVPSEAAEEAAPEPPVEAAPVPAPVHGEPVEPRAAPRMESAVRRERPEVEWTPADQAGEPESGQVAVDITVTAEPEGRYGQGETPTFYFRVTGEGAKGPVTVIFAGTPAEWLNTHLNRGDRLRAWGLYGSGGRLFAKGFRHTPVPHPAPAPEAQPAQGEFNDLPF